MNSILAEEQVVRSFADLLTACRMGYIDEKFNEKNFPLEPMIEETEKWKMRILTFKSNMNGLIFFDRLKKWNYRYRPCGPRQAMEYIATNSDLQLENPLVVTAFWKNQEDGCLYAPIFVEEYGLRNLDIHEIDRDFEPTEGFLVLEKIGKAGW